MMANSPTALRFLPTSYPRGGPQSLYAAAHETLIAALQEHLPAGRLGLSPGIKKPSTAEPFMCFERRSPGDVVVAGSSGVGSATDNKVAGSAQRKRNGAVLQHGSVLLSRSIAAPALMGLEQLFDCRLSSKTVIETWKPKLLDRLSLDAGNATESAEYAGGLGEKFEEKFASDDWTRRR